MNRLAAKGKPGFPVATQLFLELPSFLAATRLPRDTQGFRPTRPLSRGGRRPRGGRMWCP